MLASTVQFSTYNQTPPTHPRQTPDHVRAVREQEGPDQRRNSPTPQGQPPGHGPLPQDPTACLRTGSPPPPAFPTRTSEEDRAVLAAATAAGRTGQCSTLEHHPGNSRPPDNRAAILS